MLAVLRAVAQVSAVAGERHRVAPDGLPPCGTRRPDVARHVLGGAGRRVLTHGVALFEPFALVALRAFFAPLRKRRHELSLYAVSHVGEPA
ncbi:hypothetical protein ABZ897_53850 [Nonomuraea sp. NPDC046802]|uniref:hypothetical protein n=1 Tax=Nonomuraea sp. NPDC046802 TaxID=3154919 RepID=UPI0033FC8FFD